MKQAEIKLKISQGIKLFDKYAATREIAVAKTGARRPLSLLSYYQFLIRQSYISARVSWAQFNATIHLVENIE